MAKVNLDTTEVLDITCRQGDTFELTLTLKETDGTALPLATDNYNFLMQVKGGATTPGLTRRVPATASSNLVIGSANLGERADVNIQFNNIDDLGNVTLFISAADMRRVPAGRYRYDFQYVVGETHKTVLKGAFNVNADISKAL